MTLRAVSSSSFAVAIAPVLGHTEPRLATPPDRDDLFTNPAASYGHGVVAFARDIMGTPLDPWEEVAVIRAGELKADGRTPRWRKVLIIVGRQNGKTFLTRVLTMYWMAVDCWPMVFAISTTAAMAKKQWEKAKRLYEEDPTFMPDKRRIVSGPANYEVIETKDGAEYMFGAANENAGRSLSIDRLIVDELRNHKNWLAWNAAYNAMNGRPRGQAVCITNQGDLRAIVLRSIREDATKAIEAGDNTGDICLLEWSAPDDASPLDPEALAAANPNMNRIGEDGELRMDGATLLGEARRALTAGGDELATFKVEVMCQQVDTLDAAVDAYAWRNGNRAMGAWPQKRYERPFAFLDMNPKATHITLCHAAALVDGTVVVAVREAWASEAAMRAELPALLAELKPQKLGWVPGGPAKALTAYMRGLRVAGMEVVEVTGGEVPALCMGFATRVLADEVVHPNDPLLEKHITGAAKKWIGDVWRFSGGDGSTDEYEDVDGAYAAAGAVHLALTKKNLGELRVVVPRQAKE